MILFLVNNQAILGEAEETTMNVQVTPPSIPNDGELQRKQLAKAVTAAILCSATPSTALAQIFELEEVIVTATKRSESVEDVPLAITALSGDFTEKVNLNDVKDIVSFTPRCHRK